MTTIELVEFRDLLTNRLNDVGERNPGRDILAIEASSDDLDRIQGIQERDMAIGTFDRNAKLLGDVRCALDRITAGTFGLCLDCEAPISIKRLAAVPWATYCIVCQESADSAVGEPWRVATEPLFRAA
jgi:DnaK suppressor protein